MIVIIHTASAPCRGLSESRYDCQIAGCTASFRVYGEYDAHYFTAHYNRCETCSAVFPTVRLLSLLGSRGLSATHVSQSRYLNLHIMEVHDAYFRVLSERIPMVRTSAIFCGGCSVVPLSVRCSFAIAGLFRLYSLKICEV